MFYYERLSRKRGYTIVIGVDEVGRGALAGPVVVAAVFLETQKFKNRIDDSKKLSPQARQRAFFEIAGKSVYGLGVMSETAVDSINVSCAANLAADIAAAKVLAAVKNRRPSPRNTLFLLDGSLRLGLDYPSREIIGGDGRCLSIACASIVAKVVRDRLMDIYGRLWPHYGFSAHKGYGTRRHVEAIARHGLLPIHRRTFCDAT